jgi:hypothetical protein
VSREFLFESQPGSLPPQALPEMAMDETPVAEPTFEQFDRYVTEKAIDGLFKTMAAEEFGIRDELERLGHRVFDGRTEHLHGVAAAWQGLANVLSMRSSASGR